jgi:type II secretory pathway component PulF
MLHRKYRALALSFKSGISIVPALARQKGCFKRVAKEIEEGKTLAEGVKKAGVDKRSYAFLAVGEHTGKLEETFHLLADFYERLYQYRKSIVFSLLKAFIIMMIFMGITVAFFYFLKFPFPEILVYMVAIPYILFICAFIFLFDTTPGFTGWTRALLLKFCVMSGLSFTETKRIYSEAGLKVNKRSDDFAGLFPFSKDLKELIVTGQETGELDECLLLIEKEMDNRLKKMLTLIEKMFYYTGITIALATFFSTILFLAAKGLTSLLEIIQS